MRGLGAEWSNVGALIFMQDTVVQTNTGRRTLVLVLRFQHMHIVTRVSFGGKAAGNQLTRTSTQMNIMPGKSPSRSMRSAHFSTV